MELSLLDRQRISAAVHAAEAKTSGEIVCVVARSSFHPAALPILIAALALPWILVWLTTLPVVEVLGLQVALFVVLVLLFDLPWLPRLLPSVVRQRMAHRAAMEQFALRGIGQAAGRPGVLIFVSLAERYARIEVDPAGASQVDVAEWQGAVDALVGHMRDGRIADGLIEAIDRCGRVLQTHFPRATENRDELPDRLYLI